MEGIFLLSVLAAGVGTLGIFTGLRHNERVPVVGGSITAIIGICGMLYLGYANW